MKFFKYSWGLNEEGDERYCIVQKPSEEEIIKEDKKVDYLYHNEKDENDEFIYKRAKLIYGSRLKYEKSGEIFWFKDMKIEELNPDNVVEQHFIAFI